MKNEAVFLVLNYFVKLDKYSSSRGSEKIVTGYAVLVGLCIRSLMLISENDFEICSMVIKRETNS